MSFSIGAWQQTSTNRPTSSRFSRRIFAYGEMQAAMAATPFLVRRSQTNPTRRMLMSRSS
jgi:hypothetical protein